MNNINIIPQDYSFQYCLNPMDSEPIMEWVGEIVGNSNDPSKINGYIFAKEIAMLDNMDKDCIKIYINSDGGDVKAGFTIFTNIDRAKTPIYGYIGGFCLSIAGVAYQACDKRIMYPFSSLMVHSPSIKGDNVTVEDSAFLEWIQEKLSIMLSRRTKLSVNKIIEMMEAETWMDAKTAVQKGFADEIIDFSEEIESQDLEYIQNNKLEIKNYMDKYSLVQNKVIENLKINTIPMIDKLKRVLNLKTDATDIEVVNEAKKTFPFMFNLKDDCYPSNGATIPNKLVNDDDTMVDDKLENKTGMEAVTNDDNDDDSEEMENLKLVTNLKAENKKLKAELANLKDIKVVNLVSDAIEAGKISSTEAPHYIKLGKIDYNSTEAILNSMVTIKKSVSLMEKIDPASLSKTAITNLKDKAEASAKAEISEITNNGEISWDNIDYTKVFGFKRSTK